MYEIEQNYPSARGGFIHVPYATNQGVGKSANTPTMEVATIARGIEIAILSAIETKNDIQANAGITH